MSQGKIYLADIREFKNRFYTTKLNSQPKPLPYQYGNINHLAWVDADETQETECEIKEADDSDPDPQWDDDSPSTTDMEGRAESHVRYFIRLAITDPQESSRVVEGISISRLGIHRNKYKKW